MNITIVDKYITYEKSSQFYIMLHEKKNSGQSSFLSRVEQNVTINYLMYLKFSFMLYFVKLSEYWAVNKQAPPPWIQIL